MKILNIEKLTELGMHFSYSPENNNHEGDKYKVGIVTDKNGNKLRGGDIIKGVMHDEVPNIIIFADTNHDDNSDDIWLGQALKNYKNYNISSAILEISSYGLEQAIGYAIGDKEHIYSLNLTQIMLSSNPYLQYKLLLNKREENPDRLEDLDAFLNSGLSIIAGDTRPRIPAEFTRLYGNLPKNSDTYKDAKRFLDLAPLYLDNKRFLYIKEIIKLNETIEYFENHNLTNPNYSSYKDLASMDEIDFKYFLANQNWNPSSDISLMSEPVITEGIFRSNSSSFLGKIKDSVSENEYSKIAELLNKPLANDNRIELIRSIIEQNAIIEGIVSHNKKDLLNEETIASILLSKTLEQLGFNELEQSFQNLKPYIVIDKDKDNVYQTKKYLEELIAQHLEWNELMEKRYNPESAKIYAQQLEKEPKKNIVGFVGSGHIFTDNYNCPADISGLDEEIQEMVPETTNIVSIPIFETQEDFDNFLKRFYEEAGYEEAIKQVKYAIVIGVTNGKQNAFGEEEGLYEVTEELIRARLQNELQPPTRKSCKDLDR